MLREALRYEDFDGPADKLVRWPAQETLDTVAGSDDHAPVVDDDYGVRKLLLPRSSVRRTHPRIVAK
jgi:hypothetical protein